MSKSKLEDGDERPGHETRRRYFCCTDFPTSSQMFRNLIWASDVARYSQIAYVPYHDKNWRGLGQPQNILQSAMPMPGEHVTALTAQREGTGQ